MNIEFNPHRTQSGFIEIKLEGGVVIEVDSEHRLVGIRTRARDWDIDVTDQGAIRMDGLDPDAELKKQHAVSLDRITPA